MRWALMVVAASGLGLGALPARAQSAEPPPERFALAWVRSEGADECPSAREVAREVERRLGRAVFDVSAARSIEVQVTRGAEGYASQVFVRSADGTASGRRELKSSEPSCDPLSAATALAIALLIDPDAPLDAPEPIARFEPVEPPPPPPAKAPDPPQRLASQVTPTQTPVVDRPALAPEKRGRVTVAARGALAINLLPQVAPGAELGIGALISKRWGWQARALYLAPVRTEPSLLGDFEIGISAFGLGATLDLVQHDALRWTLDFGPLVGALHATVVSEEPLDPGDFLFLGLDLGSRAEVALAGGWFVEIGARGILPLIRQGFSSRGQPEPAFEQPVIGSIVNLGLGVSLL